MGRRGSIGRSRHGPLNRTALRERGSIGEVPGRSSATRRGYGRIGSALASVAAALETRAAGGSGREYGTAGSNGYE